MNGSRDLMNEMYLDRALLERHIRQEMIQLIDTDLLCLPADRSTVSVSAFPLEMNPGSPHQSNSSSQLRFISFIHADGVPYLPPALSELSHVGRGSLEALRADFNSATSSGSNSTWDVESRFVSSSYYGTDVGQNLTFERRRN